MRRLSTTLGAVAAIAVLLTHHLPVARDDLRSGPLPRDEPQVALAHVRCEVPHRQFCSRLEQELLDLPFAWHRSGYTIVLMTGAPPHVLDVPGGEVARGSAIRRTREIQFYFPWADGKGEDTTFGYAGLLREFDRLVAHEVGHTFHQSCRERATLRAWKKARGMPHEVARRGHDGAYNSVAEDYAEASVVWLLEGKYPSRSGVDTATLTHEATGALASRFLGPCARP